MNSSARILHSVTIVAVATQDTYAAVKALDYSQSSIVFADALLVSNKKFGSAKPYRHVSIDPFDNVGEWGRFIVFNLVDHINTEYILLIHEDGFVVNPQSWDDSWLGYDFIGSPFPLPKDPISYRDSTGRIIRVGNSVSLRSRRLLDAPRKLGLRWENFDGNFPHEDGFLCVQHRRALETYGIKYAPLEIAARFGRETNLPEHQDIEPFVFHKWAGPNLRYPCFNPQTARRNKWRRVGRKLRKLAGL